jgi:integrase
MPKAPTFALLPPSESGSPAPLYDSLGASDASIRSLLREGSSENTLASYRSAIQYWDAWHRLRLGAPMVFPVALNTVLQFIADHVEHMGPEGLQHDLPPEVDAALVQAKVKRKAGPFKLATVRHRLAVLSEAHETQQLPNPCRHRAVQTLLERIRTAYAKRGVRPARKDALTKEPLEQILATCDDSLIGLRDRAMLLFAWASGGRRRSEVVRATMENTRRVPEGYLYTLGYSKTNQDGAERADSYKPVVGRAAVALEAWLNAARITSGPLFRRVRRGDVIAEGLSAEAVRRIVKARAALAGLEGDYTAHSLRSGFVTEAGRQGRPLGEIMAMTNHASVASVVSYHRAGEALSSKAGYLLDEG